jgi:ABC-2 type transport system permease protein
MTGAFTGTWVLLAHALRIDRVRLTFWILGIAVMPVITYATYDRLYPTLADRVALEGVLGANPAFSLILGPPTALSSAGGFTAWRTLLFVTIFIGVMCILTVVRHTRTDEEAGRTELLSAQCVGRYAFLTAALSTAAIASVATGAVIALGLILFGSNVGGALASAVAVTLGGYVFAGVAAVAAQMVSFGRTAISISIGILGVDYLVRAWGDAGSMSWMTWSASLGWTEHIHAYSHPTWWTLLLPMTSCAVLMTAACVVRAHRDLGRGVLAVHHGPATASRALSGTFGLSWRLHRARMVSWVSGLMIYGLIVGSIVTSISALIARTPMGAIFQGSGVHPDELFVAEVIGLMGIVASIYGIQAILCAHTEETDGRVELLLSNPLSRTAWFASHLVIALVGSALVIIGGGLGTGVSAHIAGAHVTIAGTVGAACLQIPAIWALIAVTALLIGVVPRASILGWALVTGSFMVSFFGPLLKLPRLVIDLSVFTHVPRMPGGTVTAAPLIIMSAIALAAIGIGIVGIRRRALS